MWSEHNGKLPSGQRDLTVNQLSEDFAGSNPALATGATVESRARPEPREFRDVQAGVQLSAHGSVREVLSYELTNAVETVVERAAVDMQRACGVLSVAATSQIAIESACQVETGLPPRSLRMLGGMSSRRIDSKGNWSRSGSSPRSSEWATRPYDWGSRLVACQAIRDSR